MNKTSKLWRGVAAIFTIVNVFGAIYAGAMGEWMHAAVHAVILAGGFVVWELLPGGRKQEAVKPQIEDMHLDQLQQQIDSIAVNVERIGEAQRFQEKLVKERIEEQ